MTNPFRKSSGGALARLIASQPAAPNPLDEDRVLDPHSLEDEKIVESIVRQTDAQMAAQEVLLNQMEANDPERFKGDEEQLTGDAKLSRLVDDDFPFDDSQLDAIHGLVQEQYGCLTGPAGTGKTTVLKKLVDMLQSGTSTISLSNYWKSTPEPADADDEYEEVKQEVASICLCSFTGRAAQQVKSNFPTDWHPNIMTIHRMLGFYPEFYEAIDEATGEMRQTMRFVPSYNKDNLLPWDIIVVDEAGMCGLDLWHLIWAACKPTTRIFLVGDIQQLPPTHGKSIFGFAMGSWPTWELTHVHRQQGVNNSIVDNAHRVLKGLRPVSDSPNPLRLKDKASAIETLKWMLSDKSWRFAMVEVDDGSVKAGAYIREMLKLLKNAKFYDPNRDAVITAINGYDTGQTGFALGQDPMNRELSMLMNPDEPRWIIDAGRERRNFAVGDKVMATKNDWEAGITNGMTGIITSIVEHADYQGNRLAFGRQDLVDEYLADADDEDLDGHDLSLEDFNLESESFGQKEKESRDKGPASHVVTVQFGDGDSAFDMSFSTKSEVGTIQLAYVVTCHKMQGGEAPLVFIICHLSHRRMLTREWFYTAITRASGRCVVLFTRDGVGNAIGKQTIKGKTVAEKVASFQALQKVGIAGAAITVRMPKRLSLVSDPVREAAPQDSTPHPNPTIIHVDKVTIKNQTIIIEKESTHDTHKPADRVVDSGDLTPDHSRLGTHSQENYRQAKRASTLGAIRAMLRIEDVQSRRLLTHQAEPAGLNEPVKPTPTESPKGLWALINAKKGIS